MIELRNIDCMKAMKQMPDKAFDLAIVDPPYGIKADEQKESFAPSKGKGWGNRHRKTWVRKGWDDETPNDLYFTELERVSKNQIVWGANYFGFPATKCCLMWDKVQEFSGSDFELAWTSFSTASKSFRMSRIEAYSLPNWRQAVDSKLHPTQKPVKLYEWLLKNYAKEGDKILDTHLGSGSIAIACYNMGYSLTGYEIDKDYYEAAMKRLEEHKRQGRLFDAVSV